MPKQPVYWISPLGGFDDFGAPYGTSPGAVMYDGKTEYGPWANMTQESWDAHGPGRTGLGLGQKYVLQEDGRWLQVEGGSGLYEEGE
jgi:hypothetical protein